MTQRLCQMKEAESNQLLKGLPLFPDSLPTLSQKQCKQILTPILSGPGRLPYRSSPTSSPSPQLPSATIGTREQQRSKAQEQRKGFIINCSVSTNVNHRTPKGIVTLQKSQSWEMETQTRCQASSIPNWHFLISITAHPAQEAETQRETDPA